jgi:urease accessory protein UreH
MREPEARFELATLRLTSNIRRGEGKSHTLFQLSYPGGLMGGEALEWYCRVEGMGV